MPRRHRCGVAQSSSSELATQARPSQPHSRLVVPVHVGSRLAHSGSPTHPSLGRLSTVPRMCSLYVTSALGSRVRLYLCRVVLLNQSLPSRKQAATGPHSVPKEHVEIKDRERHSQTQDPVHAERVQRSESALEAALSRSGSSEVESGAVSARCGASRRQAGWLPL